MRNSYSKMEMEDDLPAHLLVQKQLQDVILTQQAAFSALKNTALETPREANVEEKVVPIKNFEAVVKELEEERSAHANTKVKLEAAEEKLEFALGEIEVLQKQVAREKMQYEKAFGQLKHKALQETNKTVKLENKCIAIEKQVKEKEDVLSRRQHDIAELNQKLKKQQHLYDQRMADLTIQQQQEEYISKVINRGQHNRSGKKTVH